MIRDLQSSDARCGKFLARTIICEEVGSSLIEYALVFLLLMTMLLGIADFARALYADHYLSNAVRDASRWAAVNGSTCASDSSCTAPAQPSDISNYITKNVPLGIDASKVTVTSNWATTPSCPAPTDAPGCAVQVQGQYQFNFIFPFVSKQTLTFTSVSQTVILH